MRFTIRDMQGFKRRGEKIPMVTAYDYTSASILDGAGIPFLLVGDSLGQVVLGYDSTLPVTMKDMLHHTKAVVRGSRKALVIGDMPFMSYQASVEDAIRNAGRFLKEAGAQAVKLEGGEHVAETVRRLAQVGIPVMAHVGLTPQSVNQLGGYKVQGKTIKAAVQMIRDARALEEAGAFSIVLESVPTPLAKIITERLAIPTIGIGAGPFCDGQVQVFHDVFGLFTNFVPKHARRYAQLADSLIAACSQYARDVSNGAFPSEKESHPMNGEVARELTAKVDDPSIVPK